MSAESKLSLLPEVVTTVLRASGNFGRKNYKVSGGPVRRWRADGQRARGCLELEIRRDDKVHI